MVPKAKADMDDWAKDEERKSLGTERVEKLHKKHALKKQQHLQGSEADRQIALERHSLRLLGAPERTMEKPLTDLARSPDLAGPVTLEALKKRALEHRLSAHSPEIIDMVARLKARDVVPLGVVTGAALKPVTAYFIVETCEQKSSWGKSYWWVRYTDELPQVKRPWIYSDCPAPPGSLCIGKASKKSHYASVQDVKVVIAGVLQSTAPAGSAEAVALPFRLTTNQ